ncbi:MAG: OB-fold nucleic acid binding domain-containing protein, partial [Alphaproteobacteria bacterium]|nr:OB-fold nucleic acid binding domain-containing protein [Alphaproteobacteria bacterium]
PARARLIEGIDRILKIANRVEEDRQTQQETLFGEMGGEEEAIALPNAVAWSPIERLTREFEAIGFYLSGHPLDDYMPALRRAHVICYKDLAERKDNDVLLAGAITKVDERKSKTGRRFAFLNLSDPTGQFETIVFSETLMQAQELLVVGNCVVLSVKVSHDTDQQRRLQAESIRPIDAVVANNIAGLRIFVEKPEALTHIKARLDDISSQKPPPNGQSPTGKPATQATQTAQTAQTTQTEKTSNISLILKNETREVELRLPNHYAITPRIANALKALSGVLHVQEDI